MSTKKNNFKDSTQVKKSHTHYNKTPYKSKVQRVRETRKAAIAKQMHQQFLKGTMVGALIGIMLGMMIAAILKNILQ